RLILLNRAAVEALARRLADRVRQVLLGAVLELDQRELEPVPVRPHREGGGAAAVRPQRPAVELHDAGPVAEPVAAGLVGDVDGVDVGAVRLLDPRHHLEVVGRRHLELDDAAGLLGRLRRGRAHAVVAGDRRAQDRRRDPDGQRAGGASGPERHRLIIRRAGASNKRAPPRRGPVRRRAYCRRVARSERSYLVLDIETVPDTDLWSPPDLPMGMERPFPPTYAHRVIVVGCMWLGHDYRMRRLGVIGEDADDEAGILQDFSSFVGRHRPALVTYNGRTFDMPV